MENISSLPKRSFSANANAAAFAPHKSVYDDVFGGAPKLGLPTLAPRLEDYSEIFGGFRSSRSSSIPVLHLPLHDSDLHFDVRSLDFDYAEVFRGFGGLDYTASFEDLVGQSSGGGYDDSDDDDEPWSPAQSGSLSDELDPLPGSYKSHMSSDGDVQQTSESIKQFNPSYNKSTLRSMEAMFAATSHVTNFSAVPGYNFSHYESSVSWSGEDEHCSMGVIDDINHSQELGGRVIEEKSYKLSSNSSQSGFDARRNNSRPLEKQGNSTSTRDKPFVTVCDISLRTKPSRLPPPSRPPPSLVVKNGESDRSNSKLKASRSYAFERVADDSAPLFSDVEIDATMSVKGRENGNKNVEVKHQSSKESIEKKYTRSHSAVQLEERKNKTARVNSHIEDEKLLQSHVKETTVSVPVIEEMIELINITEETSGSPGVQWCNHSVDNSAEAAAWREATEYFEVVEKNISSQTFDIIEDCDTSMQHMSRNAHMHEGKTDYDMFNQKEDSKESKGTKEAHRLDNERNQLQITREHYDCGNKKQKEIPNTRLSDQKVSREKPILNKLASIDDLNKKIPEDFLQVGECEKLQIDHGERLEVQPESTGNVNQVEARLKLNGSPKRMSIEKRFVDSQIKKQNSGKHKQNVLREESQRRFDDVEGAETGEMKERADEGTEKQHTEFSGRQNESKQEETYELKEKDVILEEAKKHRDSGEKSYIAPGHVTNRDEHLACEKDIEAGKLIVNELTFGEVLEQVRNGKEQKLIYEKDVNKEKNRDASKIDDNILNLSGDAGLQELNAHAEKIEPIERNGCEREVERDQDSQVLIEGDELKVFEDANPHHVMRESVINGRKGEDASSLLKHNDDALFSTKNATRQRVERKDTNMKDNFAAKDQKIGERIRRETAAEDEILRKIEEEREREREREKDRMAVDKAALEARERSYSEARERAERGAVERATAEVRQRAMAEARERLEKASMEARLRAERAAVERATAEARQRAAQKLMAQRATYDPQDQVDRSVPYKFSASSRSADTRQSFMSSDLHFQSTGISNSLRYSYSSAHEGAEGESPQRCKARLERYRRTAERAANALAEKNRRDLLAQREREERNRVAEALDAEVKRWSSGKEENLRALLSTLQYILGPDSGWHPIPLTEVITSAAVKKAYRKATLCVHPDKLQQRGATIQQKYICEKVFDLLKEAWNKFNSEER